MEGIYTNGSVLDKVRVQSPSIFESLSLYENCIQLPSLKYFFLPQAVANLQFPAFLVRIYYLSLVAALMKIFFAIIPLPQMSQEHISFHKADHLKIVLNYRMDQIPL